MLVFVQIKGQASEDKHNADTDVMCGPHDTSIAWLPRATLARTDEYCHNVLPHPNPVIANHFFALYLRFGAMPGVKGTDTWHSASGLLKCNGSCACQ